jgi:hypothetical protein
MPLILRCKSEMAQNAWGGPPGGVPFGPRVPLDPLFARRIRRLQLAKSRIRGSGADEGVRPTSGKASGIGQD